MNALAPPATRGNRAVNLARHGYAVFPLTNNKLPFANENVAAVLDVPTPPKGQGGVWLATRDETAIARLWTAFPGALIGIATGAASGGIIALDVDRKNGRDGMHTLTVLGRQLPTTAWQQSPSGGYHYLYRGPAGQALPTDAGELGEALDRRGDGGYVVDYGFDLAAQLAIAPEWLLAGARTLGNANRKAFGTDCAPSIADAIAALTSIDNPEHYDDWRNISAAFRQAATGLVHDDLVRMVWDSWCAQWPNNNKADNEKLWRSLDAGTQLGWRRLHREAYGRPPQPDPTTLFGGTTYELPPGASATPHLQPARPPQTLQQQLDGYVEIISTATGDSGKNTLLETVKVLHGNLPVAFDEFTQTVLATQPLPWDQRGSFPRPWTELDTVHCQLSVQTLFLKPGKDTVHDAVAIIANRHKRHRVRDYLNALQWDGIQRLPLLASQYFGTPDTPYAGIVMAKFMVGAVARIMQPGCKMDNVVILEGKQGTGKSTAIATLAGPYWFTDELPDLHTKDAAIQLAGKWIVEVSELSALKRSDVETIKKFMGRSVDTYRAPYARTAEDHPRQCVFVATTNDENYLKDQTGNRRFWPLACGVINVEAINQDRDQLWAEALTRYRSGERWWLDATEGQLAEVEQADRREIDPWEERIASHVAALNGLPTTLAQICFVLSIPFDRLNGSVNKRIAQGLVRAGYVRKQVRDGGHRSWQYVRE
ncbi:MAG: hypothetical protein EOR69_18740 [Mesorhizobium sp.]|nr:MAG: hypothetical protein EOR69_18740 [Mesorhizobium sp.]RWL97087.1 MAG: hypothetical protein EOR70_18080 [Mesorhizobium sp.]